MTNLSRIATRIATRAAIATVAGMLSACSAITFGIANAPASFGPFERKADIAYGAGKRQRLDVYVPEGVSASAPSDRPVVVFWYGGSWKNGSKADYRFVGAALAERGYVTVLPDYRLYPEVKFPAFLDDAARAVAWVQAHAQEFGGNPSRVVLMGHSAGAHTAAYLALNREFLAKRGARPEWIAGLVGLSGPYALAPNTPTLHRIFAAPWGESDWQPVRFASPNAPPTFLAHGIDDGWVDVAQTEDLRDALRAKGVRVETELYRDTGHGATVAGFSKAARGSAPTLDRTVAFLGSLTSTASSTLAPISAPTSAARTGPLH
jgi:acetyl esterase/lipase